MEYRVLTGREDIPMETYATFEAASDTEARARFEKEFVHRSELKWDRLILQRVDVKEVVTNIVFVR